MTTLTNIADYIACNTNLALLWLLIIALAAMCIIAASMCLKMAKKHRELESRYDHVRESRSELYTEHQKQPKRGKDGKYKKPLIKYTMNKNNGKYIGFNYDQDKIYWEKAKYTPISDIKNMLYQLSKQQNINNNMKTQQQVKEWLKGKTFSKEDATEIRIHLIRVFGDWAKAWYVGEGGTKFTYSEFIEWFSNDICESCGQPLPGKEPKFKAGDWVRHKNGYVFKVDRIGFDEIFLEKMLFEKNGTRYYSCACEKWTPEYGDIYYAKGIVCGEHIFIKGIEEHIYKGCNINSSDQFINSMLYEIDDSTIRPATSEEKQLLFDVLDKNGKVYDEQKKCLKDKHESIREEWEEYYRENSIQCGFWYSDRRHYHKIIAIEKLLLSAKFCNDKFKSGSSKWGIYIIDGKLIALENRQELTDFHDISGIFTSNKSAQQAIELLGEDTIRTALSSEY